MPAEKEQPKEQETLSAEQVESNSWAVNSMSLRNSPVVWGFPFILINFFQIRPCFLYKEEYSDCTSIKSRFHQYFIHGESIDCSQWKTDHKNCVKWEEKKDLAAASAVIKSEEKRRQDRLGSHYGNTVWTKRDGPPENFSAPLPAWLEERQKNTYLAIKAKEMKGEKVVDPDAGKGFCLIM